MDQVRRLLGGGRALITASMTLAGCASYAPQPLDGAPALAPNLASLVRTIPAGWLGQVPVTIDPAKPLTASDVAILAVMNNQDLKAARADHGVSEAQVLQAGLLPNPQLSGSYGFLLGGPGNANGLSVGLTEDIRSLITLSAQRKGARFEALKVDADLLWQEWQMIGRARLLFVDTLEGEKLRRLLIETRQLFADRYARSSRALAQGNIDMTAAAPDFTALSDIEKQIDDLDRQQESRQHDLDALLGLAPEVRLDFADSAEIPRIDPTLIEQRLPELPRRRPDLVALQLGYQSQEQKVRGAILAQFPALVFGGLGGSDTTRVQSAGPQITLDLPIFNHNQGNIAIEHATRQKLHDEYASRLTAAIGEVRALLAEQVLLQRQLTEVRSALANADAIARRGRAAFQAGNLDERGYVDFEMTRISKQQELIGLEQILLEQQVAIATLIGAEMPIEHLPTITPEPTS